MPGWMCAPGLLEVLGFTHFGKILMATGIPKDFGDVCGCHIQLIQLHPWRQDAHPFNSVL